MHFHPSTLNKFPLNDIIITLGVTASTSSIISQKIQQYWAKAWQKSMATCLGFYPFNLDACILNTDISANKHIYFYFIVITDISN